MVVKTGLRGRFPVKYLGVPLVSSRLIYRDCNELIEKVQRRVNDWKNKSLSTAGRLQLIQSVVSSLHVYWASVFILPTRILLDIEQIMRGFLWCHGNMRRGMAKVAWEDVCLPIDEGGLGIRRLVRDLIAHGQFTWPQEWLSKYPTLVTINAPILCDGVPDSLVWKGRLGIAKRFSVYSVWNDLRPGDAKVNWYDIIWFPAYIPRHALNLWLIIRRRLKTQDKLRAWDNVDWLNLKCALCKLQPDSHEHLFFDCSFAQQVWNRVKDLAGLSNPSPSMDDILHDIAPFAKRRTLKSIVAKLVVVAAAFFIWQERNGRLFKESKLSVSQVSDNILNSVRLKLMSCRIKKSRSALELLHRWKISDSIL
nr:hypothetical protein [Tanacetum cinerariifolium]